MTDQLYYNAPGQTEFDADILEVIKDKKAWKAVLDRTCFYPEGGGQPADRGWLDDIPVLDVQKEKGIIYHYLKEDPGGGAVRGKIDTKWRRDFMQQHTGQHIISGALWKVGNYKTVSVHMGLDYTTIEIEAPGISEEEIVQVEDMSNDVIAEDLPVHAVITSEGELGDFPLRKPTGRKGKIRLVKIGDFDCVGCGGLHLPRTREVRLVKAVSIEKIRGNTRIAWKIGDRALADYRQKETVMAGLKPLLATREDLYVQKTKELLDELSETKKKAGFMETRLADVTAESLYREAPAPGDSGVRIITVSLKEEEELFIKKIIKNLLKREQVALCLVNEYPDRLRWSIGCSENMDFSFDAVKDDLLPIIGGKGGGRFPLWQGAGGKPENIPSFLEAFESVCRKNWPG
jgi:alanyl-tRNA synthetase